MKNILEEIENEIPLDLIYEEDARYNWPKRWKELKQRLEAGHVDTIVMWQRVEDEMPPLEVPVWMVDNGRIMMGCRSNYAGEGWLWCRLYDMPYYIKGKGWDFEPYSDDDYKPTHWKPLPELPAT